MRSRSMERPPVWIPGGVAEGRRRRAAGRGLRIAAVVVGGAAIGGAILVQPVVAAGAVLAGATVAVALAWPGRFPLWTLAFLGLVLAGYAMLGRGFAHLGRTPIYVGELALGLVLLGAVMSGGTSRALRSSVVWILLAFMAWGAVGTLPYLDVYGFAALRDAALWGYGIFAVAVAALLLGTGAWRGVSEAYGRWLPWLLAWLPIGYPVTVLLAERIPRLPGGVAILEIKPGDVAVHLAGAGAFLLLGLHAPGRSGRRTGLEWVGWTAWFVALFLAASQNRGGMVAVVTALAFLFALRPSARWIRPVLVGTLLLGAAVALDLRLDTGGRREASARQLAANVTSVVGGETGRGNLESTIEWRMSWWGDIVGYTFAGPHFWTGKGFGVNLADDDGYQTKADHSLRSPHNGHLTVLARAGVPGLVLWILLQGAFGASLLAAYARARRVGRDDWARFDLWILTFWTAGLVNAAFDVFLEGPQGGIWFWCVIGVGIAALEAQRRDPATAPSPLGEIA